MGIAGVSKVLDFFTMAVAIDRAIMAFASYVVGHVLSIGA